MKQQLCGFCKKAKESHHIGSSEDEPNSHLPATVDLKQVVPQAYHLLFGKQY